MSFLGASDKPSVEQDSAEYWKRRFENEKKIAKKMEERIAHLEQALNEHQESLHSNKEQNEVLRIKISSGLVSSAASGLVLDFPIISNLLVILCTELYRI